MSSFLEVDSWSKCFTILLIARRSRHHAGTRYIRRGINPQVKKNLESCKWKLTFSKGFVANFVETEQIAIELSNTTTLNPVCSSYVQVRGSAPIFWYQMPHVYNPKPDINSNFLTLLSDYAKHLFVK